MLLLDREPRENVADADNYLFGSHVTKTNALESLVIASFARRLSVRDVEGVQDIASDS